MKKNKTFVALISFLVVLLGACVIYIFINDNDRLESNDLTYQEVNDLTKIIDELSFIDKMNKNYTKDKDKLPNQEILLFVYDKLRIGTTSPMPKFSYDEANKIANKYFGIDIIKEDLIMPGDSDDALYIYDKNKNEYHLNENCLGGEEPNHSIINNLYASSQKKDDIYTITVKKSFSNILAVGDTPSEYYKSYSDSLNGDYIFGLGNYLEDKDFDLHILLGKYYTEKYQDELNEYTYTFSKNSDGYVLLSYTIGK